jgi:predicted MFS family arabinose efflux permease
MAAVPASLRAVLDALHLSDPPPENLALLSDGDWKQALRYCDRTQLTLVLLDRCGETLPENVHERLKANREANYARFEKLKGTYRDVAANLHAAGVPFLVLKGFSQAPWFAEDPADRMQYDLDLFCPPEFVEPARQSLRSLGYENSEARAPTDHLPPLIRKTSWQWEGDYFDIGIPLSIELHFRFWDQHTERFEPRGLEQFWDRRVLNCLEDIEFCALHPVDRLGYSCLHLLRHVLRGNVRPYHVYELAWFLHQRAGDTEFWTQWQSLHSESLRQYEAICFGIGMRWFGCHAHPAVVGAVAQLPADVQDWLERRALAPLEALFHPNKHEVWLHLSLLDKPADRAAILVRRLLPSTLPSHVDAVLLPADQLTFPVRIRRAFRYTGFFLSRLTHHARSFFPALGEGTSWFLRHSGIDPAFRHFLGAVWLYELGLFVFVLLYNLRLLDLGYKENFLGLITGAQTAGTVAGALPFGVMVERWGIGRLLGTVFGLVAAIFAIRATVSGQAALLISAFLGGIALSAFTVAFAPAIARITREESRPLAYGIFFSSCVAMGIAGGFLGGRLPGWLSASPIAPKQGALFVACALIALAAWPVSRLKLQPTARQPVRLYPRNPRLWRFLGAICVWNLATGAFNPFFNTYFSQHQHLPVEKIGRLFSLSQFAQAGAMLVAPIVLKRCGLTFGIVLMQFATAASLAGLASASTFAIAASGYIAYMAFQWMSEPGMYSALMRPLRPTEWGGAAALNMTTTLGAQIIAAAVAGAALPRFGYPATLLSAGCVAALAALLFWLLLRDSASSTSPST